MLTPVNPQLSHPSPSSDQRVHMHSVRPVPSHMEQGSEESSLKSLSRPAPPSSSSPPVAMKPPRMTPAASAWFTNHCGSPTWTLARTVSSPRLRRCARREGESTPRPEAH